MPGALPARLSLRAFAIVRFCGIGILLWSGDGDPCIPLVDAKVCAAGANHYASLP